MITWDREQLAWAAGIIDGEGYIGCFARTSARGVQLVVTVEQYHRPEVVERFRQAMRMGGVCPVTFERGGKSITKYTWRVAGLEKVQLAVALLWPWLSTPKREQAAEALTRYRTTRAELGIRRWRRKC